MKRLRCRSFSAVVAVVVGVAGSLCTAQAAFVCTSGPPLCTAAPNYTCSLLTSKPCATNADCLAGEGTCTIRIGGTVTANPNPITTVALMPGSSNVSLTASIPPTASSGTFSVVPTVAGLDGQGIVVATDTALATCTVPVSFRVRSAVPVGNEEICPQAEGYSFRVTGSTPSTLSQLAGTSACASRLAVCSDVLPAGFEFQSGAPASRVLSIRSPITGAQIHMELTRFSAFDSSLRMMFARSADGGVTFSPFANVTDLPNTPGSVIIRGTGQWSDVKVVSAVPQGFPSISGWGKTFLVVLMLLAIIGFSWHYATMSPQVSRHR